MRLKIDFLSKINILTLRYIHIVAICILLLPATAGAQSLRNIKGTVVGPMGEPIVGANVVIKGTTRGTSSDKAGRFSLDVKQGQTLTVSFMSYITKDVEVTAKTDYKIALEEDATAIDEVLVVGYGQQRKTNISGSVASVKTDKLAAKPTVDIQSMLRGKVAGLQVTLGDARPGEGSSIMMRGRKSLKGGTGNEPLYVVDGVPITTSINDMNINDVVSMSVLKDASAQGIYGARAANGVILITTKRGEDTKNKVTVSYDGYVSFQSLNRNFDLCTPEEIIEMRRESYRAAGGNAENGWSGDTPADEAIFTSFEIESMKKNQYIDWIGMAYDKFRLLTKHDVGVSGGNASTKYNLSLGYFNQDGMRDGSGYDRYTGKILLDQKINKYLSVSMSVYYNRFNQDLEVYNYMNYLVFLPFGRIYDENGNLEYYPLGDGKKANPLLYERNNSSRNFGSRITANGSINLDMSFLLPGLKYRLNANMDNRRTTSETFSSFDDPGTKDKGAASISNGDNNAYLMENIITYDRIFARDHALDVTLMQSFDQTVGTSTRATANQLGNDFFGVNSLGSALESEVGRSRNDRMILSYMGRVNYSYKDRYMASVTTRIDGSSVFGANNKWGVFPSASLAWNINKESFMKKASWIDELKLRLSYGSIGNQGIAPYGSLALSNDAFYVNQSNPVVGYLPGSQLYNPNLKWETTRIANIGVDFSLFKRRLSGTVEVYDSRTIDLLVQRNISSSLGYSTMQDNLGEIQNKGIELSLTGYIVAKSDFSWSVSGNFAMNKNELKKGVLTNDKGEYIDDIDNAWFIGEPVNIYYNYKKGGVWQINDDIASSAQPKARPGDPKVLDLNNSGDIDPGDRTIYRRDPKWLGALSTQIYYKGFDFNMDWQFVYGSIRNNNLLTDGDYGGYFNGSTNSIRRNYWTPSNPTNECYRPRQSPMAEYRGVFGYQDASYARLNNMTLGYTFRGDWMKRSGVSRLRLYVAADNLFTLTDYLSFSPEKEANAYPETRNFSFGVSLKF